LKISSACPAVVALIRTYYPDFLPHLVDIASPMVLHAKMLKEMLGEEVKFVFAGPCAGKKKEADNHKELIDAALTFYELEDLLEIMPLKNQKSVSGFFPGKAGASSLYPMEGGLIQSIESPPPSSYKCLSFSGLDIIKDFFEKREQVSLKENLFLELLACPHGCISGPGMNTKNPLIYRKHCMTLLDYPANNYVPDMPSECSLNIDQSEEVTFPEYKDQAINEILKTIGKESVESELNCGGCGYNTCHDLAKAILSGNAERQMCVSYMRQAAQAKANAILSKIPSGFVLVNDEMKIVQANKQFANILGDDIAELYEFHNGLAGADLSKVVSFHKQFLSVLHSGEEHVDFSISHHKKHLHITFFTVFPQQLVGAVVRDMELPDIRKTEVVRKARMVIDENYETMRKVADLLGDSLARNETVLNEIIEAHNNNQV
jgi:PAS domain-containing protein